MNKILFDAGPRNLLLDLFSHAVARADPSGNMAGSLPQPPTGKVVIVGAGKAGASMAQTLEKVWPGPLEGLVLVPYGHALDCNFIEIIEAGHPIPDSAGQAGAQRIFDLACSLGPDDLLLCLLSGGGSSLLSLPLPGVSLKQKQSITSQLLICGASIHEINTVRKHLSHIKGGRLAQAAYPARTVSLLISDVPGDDPATIASGPTTGDPTTIDQAVAILAKYAIKLPKAVDTVLRAPASESPSPGHVQLNRSRLSIIATPAEALAAAGAHAQERGLTVINRGDAEEGIARELACVHSRLVIDSDQFSGTGPKTVMLSGGETTVVVKGQGTGGRNQEYLLALAIELNGMANIFAIACDTDGIDGASKVAGAIITPDTLSRARLLGMNPRTYLADNNAGAFFEALGDTVVTGPTRTNVNDFRAIVCFRDPS